MLQTEVAKSGHTIVRYNGRALSSLVDPIQEGQRWYETVQVQNAKSILLLGIGGGYQLAELLRHEHDVTLIDRNYELVKKVQSLLNLELQKWVQEESPENLLLNGNVERAMSNSCRWVYSSAGIGTDAQYFNECVEWLASRTPRSLHQHLLRRRELSCLLDPDKLGAWVREFNPTEPLSIKSLLGLFRQEAAAGRERRVWAVLEELIR